MTHFRLLNQMLAAAVLGLAVSSAADAGECPTLDYLVEITRTESETKAAVTFGFVGDSDGESYIELPSSWGGEDALWNSVDNLRVSGGSPGDPDPDSPEMVRIAHEPGAELVVSYRVIQDWQGVPRAGQGNTYRAVIQPDYVHWIGEGAFVIPEIDCEPGVSLETRLPEGWVLASDLQHGIKHVGDLKRSIFVAGDFRVKTRSVGQADIRIALRGSFQFEDSHFADMILQVINANHAYWGDPAEDFLVTVIPLEYGPGMQSVGGTGLGDAFAFFSTDNVEGDVITRILMHEYIHSWNPSRLGGWIEDDGRESEGYWFSEGFTDFLTQRIAVRQGVWTAEESVSRWNEVLKAYASSPVKNTDNETLAKGFWQNADNERMPYYRGMLFAAFVDLRIWQVTDGSRDLDDVLKAMKQSSDDLKSAPEEFVGQVQAVAGVDISDVYLKYIINGETIWLDERTFLPCGKVVTVDEPVFDYGMSGFRQDDGHLQITAVDPSGPAAPAGFKPGMVVLERLEGAVGDASVDSVLRVQIGDEVLDLRYLPTNGETVRLQRIASVHYSQACVEVLSGGQQ